MGDFEIDTQLQDVDSDAGRFRAHLSRNWEIWGPNGGYVAAIALRAAGRVSRISRPASFSGHFLRVAAFAPVDVMVVPLHRGRRSESLRVSITQDDKPVLEALVRTASGGPGLEHVHELPPDVPPPEALPDGASLRAGEGPRQEEVRGAILAKRARERTRTRGWKPKPNSSSGALAFEDKEVVGKERI